MPCSKTLSADRSRVPRLATLGYEGATLEDFLAALGRWEIETLVDVRERAQSRKRGFSKKGLGEALRALGVAYLHLPALGTPKRGRDAARRGDRALFEGIYRARLAEAPAQEALRGLASLAARQRVCLLCFERDAARCHRRLLAEVIAAETPVAVEHLEVPGPPWSGSRTRSSPTGQAAP